jgi:hypothetical protein
MVFMQYGGLLAVRNRRVSILHSNPLWGPRRNYAVPLGMIATALIAVVNLYGPGLQHVFNTTPIPGMFWGLPLSFALGILCVDEARKLIVRTHPKVSPCILAMQNGKQTFSSNSLLSLRWHGNCTSSDALYRSKISNDNASVLKCL